MTLEATKSPLNKGKRLKNVKLTQRVTKPIEEMINKLTVGDVERSSGTTICEEGDLRIDMQGLVPARTGQEGGWNVQAQAGTGDKSWTVAGVIVRTSASKAAVGAKKLTYDLELRAALKASMAEKVMYNLKAP